MISQRGLSLPRDLSRAIRIEAATSGLTTRKVVRIALEAYLRETPSILDRQGRWKGKREPRIIGIDDTLYQSVVSVAVFKGVSVSIALEMGCEVLWLEGTYFK